MTDNVDDLLKQRTQLKSQITRKLNQLDRRRLQGETTLVEALFDEVKIAFSNFEILSDRLLSSLTDESKVMEADSYFLTVESEYLKRIAPVSTYLGYDSPREHVQSTPAYAKAPPLPVPQVFDGNPESYPLWRVSFDTLVGKHNIGADEKLFFLRDYTSGSARKAIEALFLSPTELSYHRALQILEERFGNSGRVAHAFRQKLELFSKLSDNDNAGLQMFSDLLIQITVAKEQYPALDILDDEFELSKLMDKLPRRLAGVWIERVAIGGKSLRFVDFSEFVKVKAQIANHHLWSRFNSNDSMIKKVHSNSFNASQGNRTNTNDHISRPHYRSSNSSQWRRNDGNEPSSISRTTPMRSLNVNRHNPSINPNTNSLRRVDNYSHRQCPVCKRSHTIHMCEEFKSKGYEAKRQIIRDLRLCWSCLGEGHVSRFCPNPLRCTSCQGHHPTLMHQNAVSLSSDRIYKPINDCTRATTMILPVLVKNPRDDTEVVVYALLDTQSNTNFISDEVADFLGINFRKTQLQLSTISGKSRLPTRYVESLEIRGIDRNESLIISPCYTRDSIPCDRSAIPLPNSIKRWGHLSDITIPPLFDKAPIGLLIGYSNPEVFKPLDVRTGPDGAPFGWLTPLGWCVFGSVHLGNLDGGSGRKDESFSLVQGCIALDVCCKEVINKLDQSDTQIDMLSDDMYSQDDLSFLKCMKSNMFQREDGHYEAPLPLRVNLPFPDSSSMALRRLGSLRRKFENNPDYWERYAKLVNGMIDSGYAERVPSDVDNNSNNDRIWYLPHHAVDQGKLRVVYDCSAKTNGVSLNDRLLQGPDLLNPLLGILLRFRLNEIGVTCDVEKMFHQFVVAEEDRDLLRFFWWENGDLSLEPVPFRMCVHLFGATSSPGVATFGMRKIADDYADNYSEKAVSFVKDNFYVDDGITSLPTISEVQTLIDETSRLLAEGSLKLHKIVSNSVTLNHSLPLEVRGTVINDIYPVLGVNWNINTDTLSVPVGVEISVCTRREILSQLAKIYDPLGFAAPIVVGAKFILQELCRKGAEWDEPIPIPLSDQLRSWTVKVNAIKDISQPRHILSDRDPLFPYELHHFCDASSLGYAACSYIRYKSRHGEWNVCFLMGKCKVVPIKPVLSIPRLELLSAVLCARLAFRVRKELRTDVTEYFWSDSQVVLGYIKNSSTRFKVFVANRVQTILNFTRANQWYHIDGKSNPADSGSRGIWSSCWMEGPDILRSESIPLELVCPEVVESDIEVVSLVSQSSDELLDCKIFRNWNSTVKVYAWIIRFINFCRNIKKHGPLDVTELEVARLKLCRLSQRMHFSGEYESLCKGLGVSKASVLYKLYPFLNESDVICVGGRLRYSQLSPDLKHPVILLGKSEIAMAIMQHFHDVTHHQGRGITCAEIRNHGFWIVGIQRSLKRLIHNCVVCSRLRSPPCEQQMANLPIDRLTPSPPFTFVGCDIFGPFSVKFRRGTVKRYGAIFTCLVSRAVHIEVVFSLSTDSFLNAFIRFTAIRGPVRLLRCDQGTNFVGSVEFLRNMNCDVQFNPPHASHRGGVYERMIGVARRIIEGILLEHSFKFDDEGFSTILSETCSIINSRPLNVDSLYDPTSLEPLTPNHLLTMKSKVVPRLPECLNTGDAINYARKQWKRVQFLMDLFWSRWKREVINLSQSRKKWNVKRDNIKIGDIVLVVDTLCHRSQWKLARVIDTQVSSDGLVREAELQFAGGSVLKRPVQKLVHLLSPADNQV